MRLLLDENLSPRLVGSLDDLYPGTTHVREVGLASAEDSTVWGYAATNGFTIVSKDADFHQRSFLLGCHDHRPEGSEVSITILNEERETMRLGRCSVTLSLDSATREQ